MSFPLGAPVPVTARPVISKIFELHLDRGRMSGGGKRWQDAQTCRAMASPSEAGVGEGVSEAATAATPITTRTGKSLRSVRAARSRRRTSLTLSILPDGLHDSGSQGRG